MYRFYKEKEKIPVHVVCHCQGLTRTIFLVVVAAYRQLKRPLFKVTVLIKQATPKNFEQRRITIALKR